MEENHKRNVTFPICDDDGAWKLFLCWRLGFRPLCSAKCTCVLQHNHIDEDDHDDDHDGHLSSPSWGHVFLACFAGSIGASVHPLVTVTQPGTGLSLGLGNSISGTGATWEKASNPSSSPSHSQMSRNSSRKSNNSILVSNGKLECKSLRLIWSSVDLIA